MKEPLNGKYAGNKAQMALGWRRAAADLFLERPESTRMLETLFDVSGLDREELTERFEDYFASHQAAIVVPAGCHVTESNTGLHFAEDIYTFNWRFGRRAQSW